MLSTLKRAAKESIDSLPSPLGRMICSVLERHQAAEPEAERRGQEAARRLQKLLGVDDRVQSGPFAGMRYLTDLRGGAWLPKLMGTYEMEIAPAVEACIAGHPQAIVDIGAAEGYYAAGLALRNPEARVICYEQYPPARQLLDRMGRLNGVRERMEIRAECTGQRLRTAMVVAKQWLVISDCEGAEDDLLDPVAVPALAGAEMLVETHDCFSAGVSERLRTRFESTHEIAIIAASDRQVSDFPIARGSLTDQEMMDAMNEAKDVDMGWMHFVPRKSA